MFFEYSIDETKSKKKKLTRGKRREYRRVRDGRAHIAEDGRPENTSKAVVQEFHITTPEPPRQRPHEGEHDAHRPESTTACVRYHVAQGLPTRFFRIVVATERQGGGAWIMTGINQAVGS